MTLGGAFRLPSDLLGVVISNSVMAVCETVLARGYYFIF